ncbi:MAG: hypothetical protein LBU92_04130, partial [Prevotellaceae bacterium]|nr:hypothetical protein [Prevotellaceae bacterium]
MAEYNFDELVNEVANNKKRFAEYAFSKDKAQLESTKEVFALACEQIANVYLPYGFTYAKGNKHLSLKQKNNEFIYKISFWSS